METAAVARAPTLVSQQLSHSTLPPLFPPLCFPPRYVADPAFVGAQILEYFVGLALALVAAIVLRAVKARRAVKLEFLPVWATIYAIIIMPNSLVIGVPVVVNAYGPEVEYLQVCVWMCVGTCVCVVACVHASVWAWGMSVRRDE